MLLHLVRRNVLQHAHRYVMVLFSIVLATGILLSLVVFGAGLRVAIEEKSERFFGGQITIQQYSSGTLEPFQDAAALQKDLEDFLDTPLTWYPRAITYGEISLLFEGTEVFQRRIVGVDWNIESKRFGVSPEEMADGEGIVISDIVARRLGISLGDQLTVLLSTQRGRKNSFSLQVRAIVPESGLFAYGSYIDRTKLNTALEKTDAVYDLGFSLEGGRNRPDLVPKIMAWLKNVKAYSVFDKVESEGDIYSQITGDFQGKRYLVVPYLVRLDQVNYVLLALDAVLGLVVLVFVIVMVIGIGNSYRMIVVERTVEFGTMRAMGAQQAMVRWMVHGEVLLLSLMGIVPGVLLALAITSLLASLDLSGNGYLDLLLVNGRLQVSWDYLQLLGSVMVIVLAGTLGVWKPARHAARIEPVIAMRQ